MTDELEKLKQENAKLRTDCELYEAMKEGVTERITNLEYTLEIMRNRMELIMTLARGNNPSKYEVIANLCKETLDQ